MPGDGTHHYNDYTIDDRIFKFFNSNNDGDIQREEWIMGFNIFLKGRLWSINCATLDLFSFAQFDLFLLML